MNEVTLTASYIDTCFVDYLIDHYTRSNQYLASAPGATISYSSKENLIDELVADVELNGEEIWGFPKIEIEEAIALALEEYSLLDMTSDVEEYDAPHVWVMLEII